MDRCNESTESTDTITENVTIIDDMTDEQATFLRLVADSRVRVIDLSPGQLRLPLVDW